MQGWVSRTGVVVHLNPTCSGGLFRQMEAVEFDARNLQWEWVPHLRAWVPSALKLVVRGRARLYGVCVRCCPAPVSSKDARRDAQCMEWLARQLRASTPAESAEGGSTGRA